MHYELLGRDDAAAPTVLLSAGLGGAGAFWQPQRDVLAERFRVILYDHRGTGGNAGALPEGYGIAAMAEDVIEILDAAGVASCHFVGHALGGLVGLDLAGRHAGRLASLTLVNAWARPDSQTRRCFAVRRDLLLQAGVEAYLRAQPLFLYPAPWLSRHADRLAEEEALALRHFQGRDNLLTRIDALLAYDAAALLPTLRLPVLVAAARDDLLVPWTCSQQLAAALPMARLWLAAEGGHAVTVTAADRFNAALLDFLAGV